MQLWQDKNLTIARATPGKLPSLPFSRIKNEILGTDYELSLVFPGTRVATEMHQKWKHEHGPVNILSFPLSKKSGEMYISLGQARRECKKFDRTYHEYLAFLFIHGCLHLKGMTHGSTMESKERFFMNQFGF